MANDKQFRIFSTVFSHNGNIPPKYTCEGENINPPLIVENIPENTKTLTLIIEDPDAKSEVFTHWIVWNISPNEPIPEAGNPGINGRNGFGKTGYGGPCPPTGVHRYFFRIFALDDQLDLLAGSTKEELLDAMKEHVIEGAELMGLYQKQKHPVTG